jgi:hypothetical protein
LKVNDRQNKGIIYCIGKTGVMEHTQGQLTSCAPQGGCSVAEDAEKGISSILEKRDKDISIKRGQYL